MSILLLNGPPFSSLFWKEVQRRLEHHHLNSQCFDFLQHANTLQDAASITAQQIQEKNIQYVVAHGLAVPVALEVAAQHSVEHLILSNGPLQNSPVLQFLSRFPAILMQQLLRPTLSIPFCASSIAFRRLVVNPYVMERDTIVSLCEENLSSPEYRKNTAKYVRSLQNFQANLSATNTQCYFLWGDADKLFPAKTIDSIPLKKSTSETIFIPGGEHFHPIERPWALADQIHNLITTRH